MFLFYLIEEISFPPATIIIKREIPYRLIYVKIMEVAGDASFSMKHFPHLQ